jgi:hypothetical protein
MNEEFNVLPETSYIDYTEQLQEINTQIVSLNEKLGTLSSLPALNELIVNRFEIFLLMNFAIVGLIMYIAIRGVKA